MVEVTPNLVFSRYPHDVEALVVPSLGPDSILPDYSVMSIFGAVVGWEQQVSPFPSTGDSIPAVHRTSFTVSCPTDPSTVSNDPNLSVASVHHDAEVVDVRLRERVDLKPRHEAFVVAFTDCPPAQDSNAVLLVEPLIMSGLECLESSCSSVFEAIIVARTLSNWHAADGSVAVQIANLSSDGVALPNDLYLGQLFTLSVVSTPDRFHVNAVPKTPTSVDELTQAKSEVQCPPSKAFTSTKFMSDQ